MGLTLTPRLIGVTIGSLALAGSALALPASAATRHKVLRDGYTPPALPAAPAPAQAPSPTTSTTVAPTTTTAPPTTVAPAPTTTSTTSPPPVAGAAASGLSSTIGTVGLPQVVRVGDSLREVDPAHPGSLLAGDYRFVGTDAYELNTWWNVNVGCGPQQQDAQLSSLFSALGPGAVVRVWFFQNFATNRWTGARDWTALDRTVSLAQQAGVRIIATLGNQDGSCDDGVWKSSAWYAGGYQQVAGGQLDSYAQWVQEVTSRYRSSPAILAWEPINEPRPDTCTNASDCWDNRVCPGDTIARDALRSFFDQMGTLIRVSDPNHLISDGAPPVDGCGTGTWSDMSYIEASPGIDLMSYHTYGGPVPMSSSDVASWSSLIAADQKPVFDGENGGLNATWPGSGLTPSASCPLQSDRASAYQSVITTNFAQLPGFVGWLFWNAMPGPGSTCDYSTFVGDPLLPMLEAETSALNTGR